MAKNTQPVLKRCRTLGVSPGAMGYSKESNKHPGGQRRAKKSHSGRDSMHRSVYGQRAYLCLSLLSSYADL